MFEVNNQYLSADHNYLYTVIDKTGDKREKYPLFLVRRESFDYEREDNGIYLWVNCYGEPYMNTDRSPIVEDDCGLLMIRNSDVIGLHPYKHVVYEGKHNGVDTVVFTIHQWGRDLQKIFIKSKAEFIRSAMRENSEREKRKLNY